eukprot:CAMPEP_0170170972 /NCGR_PEP_ID=MMETSP0040_2-20121228/4009_1 /TAXON_ID=641309 /ORGANISM="Lotharella oceanica, Strain CCMP622" /LENGTH=522 /DNA_ID=CAMNT_0010410709 /DNA_START=20 /DNA_END=1588 /DNA_ORIENTATION=-
MPREAILALAAALAWASQPIRIFPNLSRHSLDNALQDTGCLLQDITRLPAPDIQVESDLGSRMCPSGQSELWQEILPQQPQAKAYGNVHHISHSTWIYTANGKPAMLQLQKYMKYFEVTIHGLHGQASLDGMAAVGLALSNGNPRMLVGLQKNSFGVHSDDLKAHERGFSRPCLKVWKAGDVIGVGIDERRRLVYYTRNGIHMGVAHQIPEAVNIYDYVPTVSVASGNAHITLNYGPKYKYPEYHSSVEKANQIFHRFDRNGDGRLHYQEVKDVILHTLHPAARSHRRDPLPYPSYTNFCRLTSCPSPEKGINAHEFWVLYEEGYGTIDKDWAILTGSLTRPSLMKKSLPSQLLNRRKTAPTPLLTQPVLPTAIEVRVDDTGSVDLRVDGGWSDWSECTKSCGWDGMQKRSCTEPAPSGGGKACEGPESRPCNRRRCLDKPVWSKWTPCSRTCGYGAQFRTCLSDTLDGCQGPSQRACKNEVSCPAPMSSDKKAQQSIRENLDTMSKAQRKEIRINTRRGDR